MLEEKKYVEPPQAAPKGKITGKAEKILQAQHSITGAESYEHNFGPEMKKGDPDKMTTIRISYSTREKLDKLKTDKESYESVIQRLIERSAAKKCCAARWM